MKRVHDNFESAGTKKFKADESKEKQKREKLQFELNWMRKLRAAEGAKQDRIDVLADKLIKFYEGDIKRLEKETKLVKLKFIKVLKEFEEVRKKLAERDEENEDLRSENQELKDKRCICQDVF